LFISSRQDVFPIALGIESSFAFRQIAQLHNFQHRLQIGIQHATPFHVFFGVWI
jgi:hypothetical protein